MAEYTAGTAKIEIRPNLSGFKKKLEAELARINEVYGVKIDPDLSDFREQLRAELVNLPHAEIKTEADTAAAKAAIDKLGETERATVEVDADTAAASAGIDYLAQDKHLTVEVDADTAAASAKLAAVARDREINLDVDVNTSSIAAANAGIAGVGAQAAATSGSLALMGAQATGLSILAVAAADCVGPLAAVAAAASSAVGALAVIPSVAAAAAAGIAAIGVGVSGVGKAFSAMGKSAGGGAAATGDAMKQTQRQVEAAERGIVQAQRRVEDAERRIADAQKASRKAQEDLNEARKEAARDLEELKNQLRDAALDEEDATLAVARARQRLIETQQDSDSTDLDIAEADLAHRKAIKNLEELREKNNQLARDVQAANEAGVEGSQKVEDAKEKVAQAARGEEDAQRALIEANEGVALAQERLADGLELVGAAAGGAAGVVDPFAESLANLSPNAREFVLAMQALGDEWKDLRLEVQDNLFEGLGQSVTDLAAVQLPVLKTGLAEVASEINTGLRANIAALASESSQAGLANILANTAAGFSGLNQAAGPLVQAIVDIGSAGSNYLPQLGQYLGDAATRFSEFLTRATETGQFDQWVQNGVSTLQSMGQVLSDLGGIISGVFGAAAQAGEASLGPMGQLLSMINEFVNSVQGQEALGSFFSAMTDGLAALMPLLSTALQSIGNTILPAISDFVQQAAPGVNTLLEGLAGGLSALAPSLGPIGQLLGEIGSALAPILPVLGEMLTAVLVPVAQGLSQVVAALAPVIQIMAESLTPIIEQLAPIFADIVGMLADVLVQVLEQVTPFIAQVAEAFGQVMSALLPLLPALAKIVFELITPLIPAIGRLMPAVVSIAQAFATLVTAILPVIQVLVEVIAVVGRLLAVIIGFVVEVIARIVAFAAELINIVAQLVAGIINFFTDLVSRGVALITELATRIAARFTEMWNTATQIVANGVNSVVDKVRGIQTLITDVFKGAAKWLVNAGRTIISGLWDGMKEMWENVSEWFSDKLSTLRNPLSRRSSSRNATGSITRFAAGGENHEPQYAPAGAWRVWAEPETGGELYIPLANDYRRPRAEALLAAGARHFGLEVINPRTGERAGDGYRGNLGPTNVTHFAEGGMTVEELDDFASDLEGKPYVWGGVHWGDCSGAMSGIARRVAGLNPWGGRFATGNQRQALADLGFLPGLGGAGSLSIGWFNGGPYGGHTSGTLPSGINVEMGGGRGNGQFGGAAAGANHSQYTDHAHIPADFFKPIKIPRPGSLGDLDFGNDGVGGVDDDHGLATSDPSAAPLRNFRASRASDPTSYGGGGGDTPSTISELVADTAKTAIVGHTKDILGLVGLRDDIPMVKAYSQWMKAQRQVSAGASTSTKQREISSLSQAASEVIDTAPDVETTEVTGMDLVGGLSPIKDPKSDDGDIGHVYVPGGGAEQWRGMAMAAMRRVGFNADNPAQVNAMIRQIQSESGGDPNIAQQIVDVNGTGESAGVGLLQIIPGTFAAHRDPELPNDRRNPFANMVAALRYYRSRYGGDLTTRWGKGIGYWAGGLVQGPGGPVDDLIPAFLSNNEFVVREAATRHARPLLELMNADPARARQITQSFTQQPPTRVSSGRSVDIHYHVNANSAEEGLRQAEMHARQQVMAMTGA